MVTSFAMITHLHEKVNTLKRKSEMQDGRILDGIVLWKCVMQEVWLSTAPVQRISSRRK